MEKKFRCKNDIHLLRKPVNGFDGREGDATSTSIYPLRVVQYRNNGLWKSRMQSRPDVDQKRVRSLSCFFLAH